MDSRIRFLQSASAFYQSTQPPTSAHLMLESSTIQTSSTNDRPKSRRMTDQACQSCGTMFLSRSDHKTGTMVKIPKKTTAKRQLQSTKSQYVTKPADVKEVGIQCLACRRWKKHPLCAVSKKKTDENTPKQATLSDSVTTPSSNQASKRRVKARKQNGLQALIANSRNQTNVASANDLDLMDLMEKA